MDLSFFVIHVVLRIQGFAYLVYCTEYTQAGLSTVFERCVVDNWPHAGQVKAGRKWQRLADMIGEQNTYYTPSKYKQGPYVQSPGHYTV
jgi:hypothetical protein